MKGEGEKSTKFCALNELWNLKFNIQMIKVEKCTHMTSIDSLSVTQNWREIWFLIQISLEFEIEFVEPNFGAKISLIMISEFELWFSVEAKLHGESKVIQRCFDDNKDDNKRWWQRWWQKAQRSIKEQLKWIKNWIAHGFSQNMFTKEFLTLW